MKVTHREKEVINLIAQELTTKEIAAQLYISNSTVTSHRKNAMEKLKAKNTAGLISKCFRHGILELFTLLILSITYTGDSIMAQGLGLDITGKAEIGLQNEAKGNFSTAMGFANINKGFGSLVIGQLNDSILISNQNAMNEDTPLFIVGNGTIAEGRNNALSVFGNGRMKLGKGTASADIHIKQSETEPNGGTGGIRLENNSSEDYWQIHHSGLFLSFTKDGERRAYITPDGELIDDFDPPAQRITKNNEDPRESLKEIIIGNTITPNKLSKVVLDESKFVTSNPSMIIYDESKDPIGIDYKQLYLTAIAALQEEIKVNKKQQTEIDALKAVVFNK